MALKDLGFLTRRQKKDYSNFNLGSNDPALDDILGSDKNSLNAQQQMSKYIMDLPEGGNIYSKEVPQSVQATIDASKLGANYQTSGLSAGEATKQPEAGRQSSFGTEDIVGIGLSALGAMSADKEADKEADQERARQEEEKKMLMQRQGIADRTQAQQFEQQMQAQERNQNMAGLEFLAGQRANAMKNRTAYSFRNDFAKALGR